MLQKPQEWVKTPLPPVLIGLTIGSQWQTVESWMKKVPFSDASYVDTTVSFFTWRERRLPNTAGIRNLFLDQKGDHL